MAQVTQTIRERIDFLLDHAVNSWESLPAVAEEIDTWDQIEAAVFIQEWDIQEEHLRWLQRCKVAGEMSPEQLTEYERLQQAVERNRHIIDYLRTT